MIRSKLAGAYANSGSEIEVRLDNRARNIHFFDGSGSVCAIPAHEDANRFKDQIRAMTQYGCRLSI